MAFLFGVACVAPDFSQGLQGTSVAGFSQIKWLFLYLAKAKAALHLLPLAKARGNSSNYTMPPI